jgi:quinol-cytochrome oxidoreductase complex cytochrome b subunit
MYILSLIFLFLSFFIHILINQYKYTNKQNQFDFKQCKKKKKKKKKNFFFNNFFCLYYYFFLFYFVITIITQLNMIICL